MKSEDMYKQCTFKNGDSTTHAWIEEKYAKVGLTMKFKDLPEDDTRWEVVSVNQEAVPRSNFDRQAESFIYNAHPVNKMRGNK